MEGGAVVNQVEVALIPHNLGKVSKSHKCLINQLASIQVTNYMINKVSLT